MGKTAMRLAFVIAGGATACGGLDVTAEPADIPGVAFVTLDTSKSGELWVHPPTGEDTPKVAVNGGPTEVTVLGLRAGEDSVLEVHFVDDGGKEKTEEVTVTTLSPPAGAPAFTPTPVGAASCDPGGYILFSWLGDSASGTGILDREGRYVWAIDADPTGIPWAEGFEAQVSRARPSRDGKSILWLYGDEARENDFAGIVRMSLDGRTRTDTRTLNAHHDFVELPDGKLGWLAYEFVDVPKAEVDDAPDTAPDPLHVAAEAIYEVAEGTSDENAYTSVWSMVDSGYPIYWSGAEMSCLDGFLGEGTCEFAHANSLMFRDSDASYFAMLRWTSALVKIERTGGYVWQMGGRDTENDYVLGLTDPFHHAHMSDLWEGGMLVYDNRAKPENSRLVEYDVDEAAFSATSTWTVTGTKHDELLGDVRRMPIAGCDNVIVSWTSQGRIVEMTPDGTEIWELKAPLGSVTSRVYFLPSLYDVSTALAPPAE